MNTKMLNTATKLLLALAGGALVAQSAIAGSVTYHDGDLLLGFRASGGTGSSNDLVVDLGQASTLAGYTSQQVLSIGNIGADLSSNFGSGWASRSDLFWSVAGTAGQAAVGSDPAHTLYVTTQQAVPGVQSLARVRANYAAQSGPTNKITSLGGSYVATAGVANSSTANSTVAVLQPTSVANSYASLQSTASSYGYFTPVAEGTFGSGVNGSLLDLYQLQPSSSAVAGNYVGRFSIDGTGALTFTPASLVGVNTVQLGASTYSVSEADVSGQVTVTVQRSGDLLSATSVTVATADGTAIAGTDYTSTTQTVNFGVGDTSKTVSIPVVNRSGYQGNRNFTVGLSGVSGGTTLGATTSSTVTITENIVSSVIAFNSTSYSASSGDTSVTLTFTRSGGAAPVTATIATTNGTAHAGADFVAPTGSAATVSFPANINTATATISLITPSGTRPAVNFTVGLTAAGTNASLTSDSSKLTATVALPFLDLTAPTIRVTSPSSGQAVSGTEGGSITVVGTAADNIAVASVQVALNGGAWTAATVGHPLVGYTYSLSGVTPRSGFNTVQVRATDSSGNVSSVATSSFTYVVKVALTITASTGGNVTGGLTPTTANPYPYQVGNSYKLTAVPASGYVFNGWTTGDNLGSPATDLKALSFVVSDALAQNPTITANFIASPFTFSVVGAFNGLVTATTGVTPTNSTEGFITLNVTTTGSFTGTLKIDGVILSLSGNLDNTGAAYFGANRDSYVLVLRTGKPDLVLSNVSLDLSPTGTNEITGSLDVLATTGSTDVTTASALSTFVADRAAYSTTTTAPTDFTASKYDIVIPAQAQTGLTTSQFPQGDGIGQISVSAAGVATLTGTLPDGTSLSATAPLSKNATVPLFAQLYSTKGSFSAFVTFDSTQTESDLHAPVVRWFKPSGLSGQTYYAAGWPTGVTTQLNGAKLNAAATPVIPGLGSADLVHGNAHLVFADGGLTSAQTKTVSISTTNVVTKVPATPVDSSFTLTLTAATGKASGTYKVGSSSTASLFGAQVYQKGSNQGAYGYFLNAAAGLSGGVSLAHE